MNAEEEPDLAPVGEPVGEPDPDPGLDPLPPALPDIEPLAETARELEEIEVDAPRVAILMDSESDLPAMQAAEQELSDREILSETRVMSARDEPDVIADYAGNAKLRGIRVIIAGAALSPAFAGVVAAHTALPVIGVPLTAPLPEPGDPDALSSVAETSPGAPVACVAVDNARGAAVFAARILDA